jgi:hypothetical protein
VDITQQNTNPIFAEKTLGPALIINGLIPRTFRIVLLMMLKKLYEGLRKPRMKKSIDSTNIIHLKGVKKNNIIENKDKAAFICTARSFSCL